MTDGYRHDLQELADGKEIECEMSGLELHAPDCEDCADAALAVVARLARFGLALEAHILAVEGLGAGDAIQRMWDATGAPPSEQRNLL
jgi:hypothetical protein